MHLPYRTLRKLGAPWAEGDHRVLADAELAREAALVGLLVKRLGKAH